MCGIYLTNKNFTDELVKNKLDKISFRGPDHQGFTRINNVILGHQRLAIIDLDERSNQPYRFKHYAMVFNGEIYNYKELKNELLSHGYEFNTTSDTEVLIKGYDFWKEEILSRLNGMYSFAIYDINLNKIFCARDRLGVKPFYYHWDRNGNFEICSQLRPLFNSDFRLSEEAISIYLQCGYIPSPYSIFEGVFKLQSGYSLTIDLNNKTKELNQYWDLEKVEELDITYEDAKNEVHRLLVDAVKLRMDTDVPFGTFLSGGIDSALISAIAAKLSKDKIKTFTIAFEDPKYDESKIAKQYSDIIGSNHIETLCHPKQILEMLQNYTKAYDEPFADSSALPSLLLSKVTKDYVTVALSGDGGDESFLGYLHFSLVNQYRKLERIPYILRKLFTLIPWHKFLKKRKEVIDAIFLSKDMNTFINGLFTAFDSPIKVQANIWFNKYYNYILAYSSDNLQKTADLNIKLWLENDSNVKIDRASMFHSLEVRSPFLDYRIIEFARRLSVRYRLQSGVTKRILRDILEEYIPSHVFSQPKKGFAIPKEHWIRNELKADIERLLTQEFLAKVPNLDIKKFNKQYQLHMQGKNNYSNSIWKLYMLALWYESYKKDIIYV